MRFIKLEPCGILNLRWQARGGDVEGIQRYGQHGGNDRFFLPYSFCRDAPLRFDLRVGRGQSLF
ncbi:MAG: hypothetical protein SynsKO_23480 [Synoicihabitans sp.]